MKSTFREGSVDEHYMPLLLASGGDGDTMRRAGWFDDGLTEEKRNSSFIIKLPTTPIYGLDIKPDVINHILLSTGSFAPVHYGHVFMMEKAMRSLIERGKHVAGGYFSPSHDDYVLTKPGVTMDIYERTDMLSHCQIPGWMMIDLWEGVWAPTALNFTTVIDRLEAYLRMRYPAVSIEIVMVFGSDNMAFSGAFLERGSFVCVKRSEDHIFDDVASSFPHDRSIFIETDVTDISSTKIRGSLRKKEDNIASIGKYLIRDDIREAGGPVTTEDDIWSLRMIFEKYYDGDISVIKVSEQLDGIKGLLQHKKIVSLDPYLRGDLDMRMTRMFHQSDFQKKASCVLPRTNAGFFSSLPVSGTYTLIDDDCASGYTIKEAERVLNENGITVDEKLFINSLYQPEERFCDVVDARDFLFGTRYGGLTVSLHDGHVGRAAYLYPFVDLLSRASIPRRCHKSMSYDILAWNLSIMIRPENRDFCVKDCDERQVAWLSAMNFGPDELLSNVLKTMMDFF